MAGVIYVGTPADFAVDSATDVTIFTKDVPTSAGDQLVVDGSFTIINNTAGVQAFIITLDFDALFDIEHTTAAIVQHATSATAFYFRGMLDIRSTSLAYTVSTLESAAAIRVSGDDTTVAANHLRGMGWGTTSSDMSGFTTVALFCRSATGATKTLRLHRLTIRRYPSGRVPYRNVMPPLIAQ